MAKRRKKARKSSTARKGCVSPSVAKKRNGRLKKGYKYSRGGCIRRAKKAK